VAAGKAPVRLLLDELLAGGCDDVCVVPMPGRPGVKVGLRLLSDADLADADHAARRWAEEHGLDTTRGRYTEPEWAMAYTAEVLLRALVHPESHQPLVQTTEQLRQRLTRPQLTALMKAYQDYASQMLADPNELPPEQVREIVEELRRDPFAADRLNSYGPDTLRRLLLYTVSQLGKSTGSESSSTTSG